MNIMVNRSTVIRYDSASVHGSKKDTWGFLTVAATVCKPGVYPYRQPNGEIRHELKPVDEVFAPMHLQSVAQAVVTDGHPTEAVTPRNARQLQAGQADSTVTQTDQGLQVQLKITDESLIKAIDDRKKTQISLGKDVRLDETPGIWYGIDGNGPPQKYDVVQRDMTTNHIAILAHGRVHGAQLHLDSGAAEMVPDKEEDTEMTNTTQLIIDGANLTLDTGSASLIKAFLEKQTSAYEVAKSDLAIASKAKDELQAKFDQAEVELINLKKGHAELTASIPALVKSRQALVDKATSLIGKEKVLTMDGLEDIEFMSSICKERGVDLAGKSDDYITARFDALFDNHNPATHFANQMAHVHDSGTHTNTSQRFDEDDKALNERLAKSIQTVNDLHKVKAS